MSLLPQLERDLEAAARRQLATDTAPPRRARRRAPAWLAPAAGVIVVLAVVAVFLGLRGGRGTTPTGAAHTQSMRFLALPTGTAGVSPSAIARTQTILRSRLEALVPGAVVSARGNVVTIRVPQAGANVRGEVAALSVPGALAMYDWEGTVLAPDGRPVAAALASGDAAALTISQGLGGAAAGSAQAGAMPLYRAVRLAGHQPAFRGQPHYYLFAAAGQGNCVLGPGRAHAHCLIAGPTPILAALHANLTPYERHLHLEALEVPAGWAVLQAAPSSFSLVDVQPVDQFAGFFVLRDQGLAIGRLDATAGTEQSGQPDVVFTLPSRAATGFQQLTAAVSRRGASVSTPARTLDQHFALALGDRLIEVPFIDFRQYPEGISDTSGIQLGAGFTKQTARELAAVLRSGPLPVELVPR